MSLIDTATYVVFIFPAVSNVLTVILYSPGAATVAFTQNEKLLPLGTSVSASVAFVQLNVRVADVYCKASTPGVESVPFLASCNVNAAGKVKLTCVKLVAPVVALLYTLILYIQLMSSL